MSTTTTPAPTRAGLPRPRILGVLAAALIVATASYVWTGTHAPGPTAPAQVAQPADPTSIDPVGGAAGLIGASTAQIDQGITVWAANLAREPRDFFSATTLASLYYARGRLSGDLADEQKALQFARTAVMVAPTEAGGRAMEAAILYYLHDFTAAQAKAAALYRDDPSQLGALATMADATLELGDIAGARADYDALERLASGTAVDIRLARLAFVTGGAETALALAQKARDEAVADVAAGGSDDLGFSDYAVGEYARTAGDAATAGAAFRAALVVRSTDLGSLVGLARIDAYQGDTSGAITALRTATAIAPQPETVGLLGDLLAATGDTTGAARQFATVRFIEKLGEIQSTVYDRVILRFELDHGGASEGILAKARTSLAARPDYTGYDTVAWALYRLGRYDEAAAQMSLATADGSGDARLLFHKGAIELGQGDATAGRADLQAAVALGPALDPTERAEARHLLGG
ncbi:MAG TPA: tetratricopeptide repeat protein [Candidatus Limnocylindrales bacterium]|nr:tetratricopeptide repeat protein [Candidatus Limnocylindrales bacterium]